MRSRSKGSCTPKDVSATVLRKEARRVQYLQNGTWISYIETRMITPVSSSVTRYSDDREEMLDTVGYLGLFNPIGHSKRRNFPTGATQINGSCGVVPTWGQLPSDKSWMTYGYGSPSLQFGDVCFQAQADPTIPPPLLYATGLNGTIDWNDLVDQVGSQLDGRMQTGQNLLVSLAQMAQVVGMFKNPLQVRKLLKLTGKTGTLGSACRSNASRYLEYQFGWRPLYNDIKAIANVWSEVRKHQAYLESTVNTYTPIAARQTNRVDNPPISLSYISLANNMVRVVPKITSVEKQGCFSLNVKRTWHEACWSKTDQILSRLGARDVAEALWDLVPYSFVVDWFTHVNRGLSQGSHSWSTYDLRRIGYSTKTTWYGNVETRFQASGNGGTCDVRNETGDHIVQQVYERFRGFPPDCSSVGLFGNLNQTQLMEGLALIVQRIR